MFNTTVRQWALPLARVTHTFAAAASGLRRRLPISAFKQRTFRSLFDPKALCVVRLLLAFQGVWGQ